MELKNWEKGGLYVAGASLFLSCVWGIASVRTNATGSEATPKEKARDFFVYDNEGNRYLAQDCDGEGQVDVLREDPNLGSRGQIYESLVGFVRPGFENLDQCNGSPIQVRYPMSKQMGVALGKIRREQVNLGNQANRIKKEWQHVRSGKK